MGISGQTILVAGNTPTGLPFCAYLSSEPREKPFQIDDIKGTVYLQDCGMIGIRRDMDSNVWFYGKEDTPRHRVLGPGDAYFLKSDFTLEHMTIESVKPDVILSHLNMAFFGEFKIADLLFYGPLDWEIKRLESKGNYAIEEAPRHNRVYEMQRQPVL